MKGKSIAVQIITFIILILGSYGKLFGEHTVAWFGIASMALSSVLSVFAPSGVFTSGWKPIFIVTSALGIVIQILNVISTDGLLPADIVNYVIIGITTFIGVFLKDYTGNGSITERKLV